VADTLERKANQPADAASEVASPSAQVINQLLGGLDVVLGQDLTQLILCLLLGLLSERNDERTMIVHPNQ